MKVVTKKNHTNAGKKEIYIAAQTGLGHSKSTGNPDVPPFEGKDARVTPDTPTGTGTRHSAPIRVQGARPNRVRVHPGMAVNHGGSHTKNAGE
jgi:hypothetical protein